MERLTVSLFRPSKTKFKRVDGKVVSRVQVKTKVWNMKWQEPVPGLPRKKWPWRSETTGCKDQREARWVANRKEQELFEQHCLGVKPPEIVNKTWSEAKAEFLTSARRAKPTNTV